MKKIAQFLAVLLLISCNNDDNNEEEVINEDVVTVNIDFLLNEKWYITELSGNSGFGSTECMDDDFLVFSESFSSGNTVEENELVYTLFDGDMECDFINYYSESLVTLDDEENINSMSFFIDSFLLGEFCSCSTIESIEGTLTENDLVKNITATYTMEGVNDVYNLSLIAFANDRP